MSKSHVNMILSVAAALVACAASASIEFKSGGATLRLSEQRGAVESLVADGAERVVSAAEAFTLQLLDGKGAVRVHGGGFGGTALAIVPKDMADDFVKNAELYLGSGRVHRIRICPEGGCLIR